MATIRLALRPRPALRTVRPSVMTTQLRSAATTARSILVTPAEVNEALKQPKPPVLLDASWFMPNDPRSAAEEYRKERLPAALRLDLDAVADTSYRIPARSEVAGGQSIPLGHMLPSAERFAADMGRLGIAADDWIVVSDAKGIFSSPRAAWMFEAMGHPSVSVLDGGLPRWRAEGYPLDTTAPSTRPATTYRLAAAASPSSRVASYEDVVGNSEAGPNRAIVCDARSAERFHGSAPEPRPNLSSGHIANSVSLPFTALLSAPSTTDPPYQTMLKPAELEAAFVKAMGEDAWKAVKAGDRAVWQTCGSGMTAAIIWLGLRVLGVAEGSRLYDESWTGWASRPDSKIVKS